MLGRGVEGRGGSRVQLRGRKRALSRDVGEADQRMHHRQLARVVQLQAGNAFAGGEDGRLAKGSELPPIDEGF